MQIYDVFHGVMAIAFIFVSANISTWTKKISPKNNKRIKNDYLSN